MGEESERSGAGDPAWVELTTCAGMMAAQLLQMRLESAGIPVLLRYETAARLFGITLDGLGRIQVMVSQGLYDDALAVLNEPTRSD